MESFCSIYQQKCIQLQIQPIKAILALFEKASKRGATITQLDLSYKALDSRSVVPICAALGFNITITHLNLGYNLIEKRGCKAIAEALRTNTSISLLDLSGNKIGDDGVKYLADALAENATLVTLLLKNNNIHDVGVCDLSSALTANNSLKELDLSQNIINATGGEALATALMHNTTLERLGLSNTKMPQTAIYAISLRIGKSALKQLDVRGNAVDGALLARLNGTTKQQHVPAHNVSDSYHKDSFGDHYGMNNSARLSVSADHNLPRGGGLSNGGNDKNIEEHLLLLASSLRRDLSLLELGNGNAADGQEGKKMSLRLESLTQQVENQLGGGGTQSYHYDATPATSTLSKQSSMPPQHQIQTIETLRQLNNQQSAQIAKLQQQLKVQHENHRRKVDSMSATGDNSDNNLRAIIVEMKESMNRMERELVEKSKKTVAVEHEMEKQRYAHENQIKDMQAKHAERIREIRAKAQGQYDQLCQDYLDYQQKSKAEFLSLYNDFDVTKKQLASFQQQNARQTASLEEQHKTVAHLNNLVSDLGVKAQHTTDLRQKLKAAEDDVISTTESTRLKDEELRTLRADNEKLAYWLKSMQKAVSDVSRAEGASGKPSSPIKVGSRSMDYSGGGVARPIPTSPH